MDDTSHLAVAIVGVSAILPDAPSAKDFWANVKGGRYSISEVPKDRWDPALYWDPDHAAPEKTYSKIGGWVRDYTWDPAAWKLPIPPRVAEGMDGGQKWAVACARGALLDYGYPDRALDLERTACILGNAMAGEKHYLTTLRISFPEYAQWLAEVSAFRELPEPVRMAILEQFHRRVGAELPPVNEDTMPGELSNCIAGRVANVLNLHGPNFTCDAACASAMAAISAARDGLIEGAFDAVVTGGIDRNMGASSFVKFSKIGALSATGTRPFADGSDGFVMGEGAAVFVLKRLADAEAAGDRIYAVLRGMAGSSDGKGKGITAPNPVGQKLAVRRAWKNAGLTPAEGMMIEAHGTSTPVGDVVEVSSLNEVLGVGLRPGSMHLGSVKSNIGHLKGAAGAAGLLKAALSLHEKVLPPSLNFQRPNPNVDWTASPFRVNTELRAWERPASGVRAAGVSAFGFGGTNFHMVLEEHVPGRLRKQSRGRGFDASENGAGSSGASAAARAKAPLRGALVCGARSEAELSSRLSQLKADAEAGRTPDIGAPSEGDLSAPERVAIDWADAADLAAKAGKALKALAAKTPAAWKPLRAQGVFRGSGPAPKVAFLYTGQGSQYVNMLRDLSAAEPIVSAMFAEADRIMAPTLGKPLTAYVFVDKDDRAAVEAAEEGLRQTAITQPAVLAVDLALTRVLGAYGIAPDMVMGHSLGEYGALVAAGCLPFEDALEAVSARGKEMSHVKGVVDTGRMAAVMGPLADVQRILGEVKGYVVTANINSNHQVVIGGSTAGVTEAAEKLMAAGMQVIPIPVSHAFHTSIVAPASEPLKRVLARLRLAPPKVPIVANTTGEFYPSGIDVPGMLEVLGQQVAAPVQFVRGLKTLYEAGARVFVEVGPKKALQGFADDVLGEHADVLTLFTNHPKFGDVASLNQALCGLYARGLGRPAPREAPVAAPRVETPVAAPRAAAPSMTSNQDTAMTVTSKPSVVVPVTVQAASVPQGHAADYAELGRGFVALLERAGFGRSAGGRAAGAEPVVITGASLGLPGGERVFDDSNVARILGGEQRIDVVPSRLRKEMAEKHVTRLVKKEGQDPVFETIDDVADVIKLAGRGTAFDFAAEYGLPEDRVASFDQATKLAMAAGLDALRDAGIPLVPRYRATTKGTFLPDGFALPESMRDDTGVVFASAFPGINALIDELDRFHEDHARRARLTELEGLRARVSPGDGMATELDRRIAEARAEIERSSFAFDRRFLFRVLSMGHSQFAEYIRARGPNTAVNAACASTTQAVAVAEDWIASGRCRRVIVIGADDITSDTLLGWFGTGFLAAGAAATEDIVENVATPFDRRRHGMIVGMGAAALVLECRSAASERGIEPIAEVLGTITANSAFHGTRLDVNHITEMMERLVRGAEERWGISRAQMAAQTVFVSHETYTPARGGSAAAEIFALRHVFGAAADRIVIANTKGFTGHAMGAGIEDVVAVKALETGVVPEVPNFKEIDPELGALNLSKGGSYPIEYALRLGAGFGSQISLSLVRRASRGPRPAPHALGFQNRVDAAVYPRWLAEISGYSAPSLEVVKRTLRIKDQGPVAVRAKSAPPALASAPAPVVLAPAAPVLSAPSLPAVAAAPRAPEPPSPVVAAKPLPAPAAAPALSSVAERVLALVAEKTGYPRDMLALDLDLEADLGIDTVKQAEVFATIREAYGIARDDSVKLRDYPTLGHVIRFVNERVPGLEAAAPAAPSAPLAAAAAPSGGVEERVLLLVAEKTGYPRDMLALDLDLEADLGIDTVKQAEVFATIRQAYDIARDDSVKLRDYPTLGHVIRFVRERRPGASAPAAAPAAPEAAAAQPAAGDEIEERVLLLVAEKTGYPRDMLALDLDLEADLGIDTVKQAEVFATIRQAYGIGRDDSVKLRDYPTLGHVIRFVKERRAPSPSPEAAAAQAAVVPDASPALDDPASAARFPRRVPTPVLRPALDLCRTTGVSLAGKRVLVMADRGGVADALSGLLDARGATVLRVDDAPTTAELAQRIEGWLAEGGVDGVYWLPALDAEAPIHRLALEEWRAAIHVRVKLLAAVARAMYGALERPGAFFVSGTRLGGRHGYDAAGAQAPLGGGVTGFTKALKRERPSALVKCVDFALGEAKESVAARLVDEALRDPAVVEIGYARGLRWTVGFDVRPPVPAREGSSLATAKTFVVTGAAGSITSAITADLAAMSGGTFYLLDRVPEPDRNDPDLSRLHRDREGLKRDIFERLKAKGERATPAAVEKELAGLERASAALQAILAVEAAGGKAVYVRGDLRDGASLAQAIDRVRSEAGGIDVLVHAAGLEISRLLPDKSEDEFDLVFDTKADGLYHLMRAIGEETLGAVVVFSSIAGRFGNGGQTDYSAANDLLCKVTSSFRTHRPETRGVAIDWTAWDKIGMASRGSIPKLMEAAGIEMLPPEVGIPVTRQELLRPEPVGEVVIAGTLGLLMKPWDEAGGVDPGVLPELRGPMLGKVTRVDGSGELTVETTLDPARQGFLYDHRIDGVAVLPGVMGVEAFAEVAALPLPGWVVVSVEDVEFAAPFKFYRDEPRAVTITAIWRPDGDEVIADCKLEGTRTLPGQPPQTTVHYRARVRLAERSESPTPQRAPTLPPDRASDVASEDIYRVYFHGPAYQVLERAWREGDGAAALVATDLPANHQPEGLPTLTAPRLVESCFQTAGIWEMGTLGRMGLPQRIDRVTAHVPADDVAGRRLYAVAVPRGQGYDARIVDADGNVYVEISGYRTVQLPVPVDAALLAPLRSAMA